MSTYKLTYFPVKALAEPICMLLNYGNQPFEDYRFEREDWPKIKPTMPFGQVPVLEIDGQKKHQSLAIIRYLGRKFGLAGANDLEDLDIDSMADTITDLRQKLAASHYETDETVKQTKYDTLVKEVLPFYCEKLDAIAKENNGYLAAGKLTWVDVYFVGFLEYMNFMARFDITEKYPNLQKVRANVEAEEKFKSKA